MLDRKNKNEVIDSNYLLNKRAKERERISSLRVQNRLFIVGIIIGLIILCTAYFLSNDSKVYTVNISGNRYFNDEHYLKLSGLNDDSLYDLSFSFIIENRIKSDPLVDYVDVRHLDNKVIKIDIKEKEVLAYIYLEKPYLLIKGEDKLELDQNHLEILSKIPFIEGYDEEDLKIILKGFDKLDTKMINEISEIHHYPFSYDDKMMEVIMRDGNYIYLSYYALHLINNYHDLASGIEKGNKQTCIFIDEMSNSAYTSDCPFWTEGQ